MKKLLFMLLLLSNTYLLRSQSELHIFTEWASSAGSQNFFHKSRTKTDGSGNVYVTGATVNSSGNYDILVAKYNSSGVQQWIQQYNGYENYHDFATAVFVDASGNVYITGTVSDSSNVQGSDIITNKYNSSGTLQWSKRYNGSGNFYDSGADIIVDGSGNVYITGGTYTSTSLPYSNAITIKYNSSGTQQWATLYNNATYNLSETGAKIIFSGATKVSVAGAIQTGLNTYSYGRLDYSISTGTQSGGVILGTGTSNIDYVGDFVQDNNKNTYIAGATYDSVGSTGYNYYIMKLDSTLAMQWERTYNGASNLDDMANGIKVDPWGNVYVTGYSTSSTEKKNIVTRKYNSGGSVIWTQTYNDTLNGDDAGMAMAMDASGNICIAGYDSTVLGSTNYLAIKYDTSGAQQWIIRYDGMKHLKDMATDVCIDDNGDFVVTGMSETAANTYEYITIKYVEKNIITPTDAMGEEPASNFLYYENKGQLISTDSTLVPDVRFYTNNSYPSFYFKDDTMSMVFSRIDTIPATDDTLHRIDMAIEYSDADAKIYPMEEQRTYLNYFLAHCPDGVTGVFGNEKLVIPGILDKIDLIYTSNQNGVKFYFVIAPGADPTKIGMLFNGASSVVLDTTTQELTLNTGIGNVTFDQPFMYQIDANNDTISGSTAYLDWLKSTSTKCYFTSFPSYDTGEFLIIEVDQGNGNNSTSSIANLEYSTFYGGAKPDEFSDVKTDMLGNIFTAGTTESVDFPVIVGVIQDTLKSNSDGVIVKFNKNDLYNTWSTYYGGTGVDFCRAIAIGPNGGDGGGGNSNVYAAGSTTSSDFPTLNSVLPYGGGLDGFIFRLNEFGTARIFATTYGGFGDEILKDIAIDNVNNLFAVGRKYGSTGYTMPAYAQTGTTSYSTGEGVIVKLSQIGVLKWASQFGTYPYTAIQSIAIDQNNNIFLGGGTKTGFNTYNGVFQTYRGGNSDGFLTKLNASDNNIAWSTYFGGNGEDVVEGIAINTLGDIAITGFTLTPSGGGFTTLNYPTGGNSFGGGSVLGDAFIGVFSNSGSQLYGSYFGGNGDDIVYGLCFDSDDRLYLTGNTSSTNTGWLIPTSNPIGAYSVNTNTGGGCDAFFATFDSNYIKKWGSFFGGGGQDYGIAVATFENDNFYLAGRTISIGVPFSNHFPLEDFIPGVSYYQDMTNQNNIISTGYSDGFLSRFDLAPIVATSIDEAIYENLPFKIYPNPSSGLFTLDFYVYEITKTITINIYNTKGQLVYQELINKFDATIKRIIDLNYLSDGLYLINIQTEKSSFTSRLIKN